MTFNFGMTVVGAVILFSFIKIFEQFNLTAMQTVNTIIINLSIGLFYSVSCGVAFVG